MCLLYTPLQHFTKYSIFSMRLVITQSSQICLPFLYALTNTFSRILKNLAVFSIVILLCLPSSNVSKTDFVFLANISSAPLVTHPLVAYPLVHLDLVSQGILLRIVVEIPHPWLPNSTFLVVITCSTANVSQNLLNSKDTNYVPLPDIIATWMPNLANSSCKSWGGWLFTTCKF